MDEHKFQYKLGMEKRMSTLETLVNEIKDNHLVHLEQKVDRILWLVITTLVGIITSFLVNYFT